MTMLVHLNFWTQHLYKKNNDKFGSYYVIDGNGLKIYDKDGYIRTAIKK